jgi:hypothetical protein
MKARGLRAIALVLAAAYGAAPLSCSSAVTAVPPVECGPGTVTCTMDSKCCPSADPWFCGGLINLDDLGCYPSMQAAASICGTSRASGKTTTLAYQCH